MDRLKNGNCLLYINKGSRFTGRKCVFVQFVKLQLVLFVTKAKPDWPIIRAKSINPFCALALAVVGLDTSGPDSVR